MQAVGERLVQIESGGVRIEGSLAMPENARGIVVFAHGSGNGRFSPRNQYVAMILRNAGLGTLLMDLLDEREADERAKVFDIGLLTTRVIAATDWLREYPETAELAIGYFGASTGAAAALQAAAKLGPLVKAVVSRGGRPDLAALYLKRVMAPTLLIVGGNDLAVIPLNQHALGLLSGPKDMRIVPGATHLFEEEGALDQVAGLATEWLLRYLVKG